MSSCDKAIPLILTESPPITGQKEGRGTDNPQGPAVTPRSSTLNHAPGRATHTFPLPGRSEARLDEPCP